MPAVHLMFDVPADLEVWLMLAYVMIVFVGARIIEALARAHLDRATRPADEGFEYRADEDRYDCPGGERLALHSLDASRQLAVYQALPHQCENCPLKAACAPHGYGRRIYRSLATWAESDVGRFHAGISLLMFAAGGVLTAVGFWKWSDHAGSGYLLVALLASTTGVSRKIAAARGETSDAKRPPAAASAETGIDDAPRELRVDASEFQSGA
jgi:hypothetical protein